jgi:hypothetical protein
MRELERRRAAEKAEMDRRARELAEQKQRESDEEWRN